jgi:hypothetical protein
MMATDRIVATKSKVLYVRIILGALTWIALWLGVVSLVSALFESAHVAVHESTFGPWTFVGVGLIVLCAIPKWLTVSSTSWSVDDEWVTVRGCQTTSGSDPLTTLKMTPSFVQ